MKTVYFTKITCIYFEPLIILTDCSDTYVKNADNDHLLPALKLTGFFLLKSTFFFFYNVVVFKLVYPFFII